VDSVPDPPLLRKSGRAGNRTRASGSVATNSDMEVYLCLGLMRVFSRITENSFGLEFEGVWIPPSESRINKNSDVQKRFLIRDVIVKERDRGHELHINVAARMSEGDHIFVL
jgi:hypothetical protein